MVLNEQFCYKIVEKRLPFGHQLEFSDRMHRKTFLCENENEFNAGAFQRDFHEKQRAMPNWLISFEASTDRTVFAHMQIECDFQCQPRKKRLPHRASFVKQEC